MFLNVSWTLNMLKFQLNLLDWYDWFDNIILCNTLKLHDIAKNHILVVNDDLYTMIFSTRTYIFLHIVRIMNLRITHNVMLKELKIFMVPLFLGVAVFRVPVFDVPVFDISAFMVPVFGVLISWVLIIGVMAFGVLVFGALVFGVQVFRLLVIGPWFSGSWFSGSWFLRSWS